MDVREKLVELLYEADRNCNNKQCETCKHQSKKFFCKIHFYIDHLIAHGITVQDNTEISDELLKQLRKAPVTILQEEPTIEVVQEWISVKDERKPDHGDIALCYMAFGEYRLLQWDDRSKLWVGDNMDYGFEYAAYWQLPQPPKGE